MIITLDGPAGSGKSSTARAIAERTPVLHVDTGVIYRTIAFIARASDYVDQDRSGWHALRSLDLSLLDVQWGRSNGELCPIIEDPRWPDLIRATEITAGATYLAQVPAVRSQVITMVRELAYDQDLIVSGRDAGTAIFPDAQLKIYLTADLATRAARRLLQRGINNPSPGELDLELQALETRDCFDRERPIAPLTVPLNAVVIDSTNLSFEQQVQIILERITLVGR